MYQDANLQVSAAQAITATAASTNVIDLGAAVRDIGKGVSVMFDMRVGTAFTAAGAATLTVQIQVADDAGFTINVQTLSQTDAIPKASLPAGQMIRMSVDQAEPYVGRRFMRLNYVVATGPMTAGTITAALVKDTQDPQVSPPSGFAVL
jgi:hypothetical protein